MEGAHKINAGGQSLHKFYNSRHIVQGSDQGRGNMAYLSTLGNKQINMRESLFFGLHLDSDNIGVVSEDKNTEESWE